MAHAFRLGPLQTPEEPVHLFAAFRPSGEPVVVFEQEDVAGLRALQAQFPDETLTVEPPLAKAGKRLGLRRSRLPRDVALGKAVMALSAVLGDDIESDVEPDMIAELLEVSVDFMKAKPWRFVDITTVLEVSVDSDGTRRRYEGSLMGGWGRACGVLVHLKPGTLGRLMMSPDDDLDVEELAVEELDALSIAMDTKPSWAAKVIKEVTGIRVVPAPLRLAGGQPQSMTVLELATACTVLRAASQLARDRRSVQATSTTGPSVEVAIAVPGAGAFESAQPGLEPAIASQGGSAKKIGRNAPCPCGSGRKYKRCCLRAHEQAERSSGAGRSSGGARPSPARRRRSERSALEVSLVEGMLEFADRQHPGWRDDLPEAWRELGALPSGPQLLFPLLAFHRDVEPGLSLRQSYLDHHAQTLVPDARTLLTAQADAVLSVWEVLKVDPGVSIEVIDLLTGVQRLVFEVRGSQGLAFRDTLLARVVTVDGRSEFSGFHPRPLGPAAALEVVAAIRRLVKLKVKPIPRERLAELPVVDALLREWHAAHARVDAVREIECEVCNTDQEPFAMHEDRFRFERAHWRDVAAAILELPGVYCDEQSRGRVRVSFTKPSNAMHPHWHCTVIGEATIDAKELTVEANSEARIDRLRTRLERQLGPRIVHHERKASPPRTIKRAGGGPVAMDATRSGLWAQPEDSVLREQARHYVDTSSSRLGDRTPRQAMRTARDRRALHQVLKEHEHRTSSASASFAACVREQLGLSLTGEVVVHSEEERRMGLGRKISETLLDFAAPLLLELEDEAQLSALLELAALTWNMDVFEREGHAPGTIERGLGRGLRSLVGTPVDVLHKRRRRFFAEDRRIIKVMDVRWSEGHIYVKAAALAAPRPPERPRKTTKVKPRAAKPRRPKQLDLLS